MNTCRTNIFIDKRDVFLLIYEEMKIFIMARAFAHMRSKTHNTITDFFFIPNKKLIQKSIIFTLELSLIVTFPHNERVCCCFTFFSTGKKSCPTADTKSGASATTTSTTTTTAYYNYETTATKKGRIL